jgi:hypothetical protein
MQNKFICLSFLVFASTACQNPVEFRSLASLEGPQSIPIDDPLNSEKTCIQKSHIQEVDISDAKLDMVLISDTSGSFTGANAHDLAHGLKQFAANIPDYIDLNLAVLPAEYFINQVAEQGIEKFVFKRKDYISLDEMAEAIYSHLIHRVSKMGSYFTDGGEAGLSSLAKYTEPAFLNQLKSHGMFRDHADLAIVFASDENDLCAIYPEGVEREYDGDKNELPYEEKVCDQEGHRPADLKNLMAHRFPEKRLITGGVLYLDPAKVPGKGEDEVGYGYLEFLNYYQDSVLMELSEGVTSISLGLSSMAEKATRLSSYKYRFPASVDNYQAEAVKLDGVNESFEIQQDLLIITGRLGNDGSTIEITYCK